MFRGGLLWQNIIIDSCEPLVFLSKFLQHGTILLDVRVIFFVVVIAGLPQNNRLETCLQQMFLTCCQDPYIEFYVSKLSTYISLHNTFK